MNMPAKKILSQTEAETKLKKAHIRVMRHNETFMYAGVFLLGKSVVDDETPTAKTDGKDKYYGREFMSNLTMEETCGLVLHENLHVLLKHIPRFREQMQDRSDYIHVAIDLAVNSIIMDEITDRTLCKLPAGGAYHPMFKGWSVQEIRHYLYKNFPPPPKQEQQGGGKGEKGKPDKDGDAKGRKIKIDGKEISLEPMDDHDADSMQEMTPEQIKDLSDQINEALQQGALLAGRNKGGVPRLLRDAMAPEVNWREETQEFITAHMRGTDELTWRTFNRRRQADDYYLPSTESETVDELVAAFDTSGSIGQDILNEFATHLVNVCEAVNPKKVRVLWWDTEVHGEQIFEDGDYQLMRGLLKPAGGGGTRAGSVSQYMVENRIEANCVIVLTDGYTEQPIKWETRSPTLWLVTQCASFRAPAGGRVVKYNK